MAALRGDELETSLQGLVQPGPLALEKSGWVHTFGLCLRDETVRDPGTDSGLTSDARTHLSGTAGVRICACRRRRGHQRERQHYGGECCRGSHCDSHCGAPFVIDPRGRRYARTALVETRPATVISPCWHGSFAGAGSPCAGELGPGVSAGGRDERLARRALWGWPQSIPGSATM
jgi:hypothetical protein